MYVRVLVVCLLMWCLGGEVPGAWAQITPPAASPSPSQVTTAGMPAPTPAARDTTRRTVRQPVHPKVLRLRTEAGDRAVLRRYRYRTTLPDSVSALHEVRDLILALQADAYLTASADIMRWGRDTLAVQLYIGEKFRWARLRNGNLGDGLMTRAGYREKFFRNQPFLPTEWTRLQQRIIGEAETQGYPFAAVRLDSVELRGADIEARIVLDRGPVILFDSIQIVGSSKTKKRFLTKYLQIFPNQPYNQQRVDAAAQLLRQLPYVQVKGNPEVRFAQGKARVYLLIDERNANQFDAIVGVVPNSNTSVGQRKLQLTGDVTINLRNLRGGGKQVGLQWRKVDIATQSLDAHYLHPNFFGTPLELGASFNLYKQANAFLTIRPRVQITYPTARAGRLTFFTERRSSRLLSDSASLARLTALPDTIDSQYNAYGVSYEWNTLDDLYFPRRGLLIFLQSAIGTKQLSRNAGINESFYDGVVLRSNQVALSGRVEQYIRIGGNGVLMARVRGESLLNQRLFLNDMFRIGGLATLRGFSENYFYTNSYAVGTAEFRQFTGTDAYVFLFVDQAYLRRDLGTNKFWDAPTGVGAGLSFRTGAGVFQFVYSMGQAKGQRLAPNASKIHFGITSRF
ncbi:POTRA domain-containing protein [Hymenobacter sp. GOD-10R]|uniref:POTRA domain-containing protein n=1 Tax=Hymenobacter sp. GOD-10R TaxID=3093922 RepID=UPI002D764CC5|nr:POTRA domain-containing protein [Hymenobacter sp. GOD-10R]WRQ28790.1 POTRA domain-containing protein [Hymenobacter sp. GOD-10R]